MASPLRQASTDPLAALRVRLDEVDYELHKLIMERFAIVAEVGRAKGPQETIMRPAREAEVLARRLAAHAGAMPTEALAQVWRVLIATASQVQRPYLVHVVEALEAARFLFGPIPTRLHGTVREAVDALGEHPGDAAVVGFDADERWWEQRGTVHATSVAQLGDGRRAIVLGGAGVDRGTGSVALVARGTLVEIAATAVTVSDDVVGLYDPFPLSIPVAS